MTIATPQKAHHVLTDLNLPTNFVYVDPEASIHKTLNLHDSFANTFLSPYTPLSISKRIFNDPLNPLSGFRAEKSPLPSVLSKWIPSGRAVIPPKQKQAFNQGGVFVFSPVGRELVFAHADRATGDHADIDDVKAAAGA